MQTNLPYCVKDEDGKYKYDTNYDWANQGDKDYDANGDSVNIISDCDG